MDKVAVLQSNYIPWKGYFDIINDVDTFIFHDDLQFTKNDWRNRNKIKTETGVKWLTIPVGCNEKRLICEVVMPENTWGQKHWNTIEQFYGRAPYFNKYRDFFREVYLGRQWATLSELNHFLIKYISKEFLGIKTVFKNSRDYHITGTKLERLLELLKKAEARIYVSGPSAQDYIEEQKFKEANIQLIYKDYSGYPEYPQFYPPFEHSVSIIDLLFQTGPEAPYYIWGWRG